MLAFARKRDTTSLVATHAGRQSAVLTREAQRAYRPGMVETSATFTGSIPHYYDSCFEENPHILANAQVFEGLFPGDAEMRFRLP